MVSYSRWSLNAGSVKLIKQTTVLIQLVALEQWSVKPGGLLVQVVSNTGFTVIPCDFMVLRKVADLKKTHSWENCWYFIPFLRYIQ